MTDHRCPYATRCLSRAARRRVSPRFGRVLLSIALPRVSHDAGWRREERATDDAAADDVFSMTTLDRSTLGAIGFGAAPLGNLYRPLTDAAARATLRAAWDAGIRYFDTEIGRAHV